MTRWKRIRHAVETAGVRVALAAARALPLGPARALGAALGGAAFDVFRVRRAVSVDNVARALAGTPADADAVAIARRSYRNLGRSLMEYSAFARLGPEDVRALVRFEGLEHFDAALAAGRGAVLFTGHFGNWELLGAGIAANGYPIHFLVGEQTNASVDRLMNELRQRQGIGIISRHVALKKVLRALRDNQFVALLADQDARRQGVFVDFFGRPASTVRGPAMFAIKQRCPIVPGFIHRDGRGHVAVIEPPLWPEPGREGDDALVELTQRFTRRLEANVREHPAEYFWAHRRWKTSPPAA